jgi:hypothetical protein
MVEALACLSLVPFFAFILPAPMTSSPLTVPLRLFGTQRNLGIFALVLFFIGALLYRSFYFASFWLDETLTVWVVQGSITSLIDRVITFQGQSPLYYMLVWVSAQLFGVHEYSIRLPSLLALIGCGVMVYSIGKRLIQSEAALLAIPLFFSLAPILRSLSARPYALALLFFLLAVDRALAYRDAPVAGSQGTRALVAMVIAVIAMYYTHYLFIFGALVPLAYVARRAYREHRTLAALLCAASIVLAIPGVIQLSTLFARRETLYFAPHPDVVTIVKLYLPPSVTVSSIAALLISWILAKRPSFKKAPSNRRMLYAWYLLPPLPFLVHGYIASGSLVHDRYFLWYLVPLVLLVADLIMRIIDEKTRFMAMGVLMFLLAVGESERTWGIEGWREAAQIVQSSEQREVLLVSGLIESAQRDWLDSGERAAYLRAPLTIYGVTKTITHLPLFADTPETIAILEEKLSKAFEQESAIHLVYFAPLSRSLESELVRIMSAQGVSREIVQKGIVRVELISRSR